MASRFLLAALFPLFAGTAFAQSDTLPEKSVDQIRCELEGNCLELDLSSKQPAEPEPGPTSEPATALRGFSWQPRQVPTAARPANRLTKVATPQPRPAGRRAGQTNLAINFVAGSAAITDEGRRQATSVFAAINSPALSTKRFLIAGHTNATGTRELNLALSRARAEAMVEFLVASGLDRSRFDVAGYGFDRPLAGTSAKNGANRRVEIVTIN
jgi:outer membrane protein OmpA-like peptidoglycan-associated protein